MPTDPDDPSAEDPDAAALSWAGDEEQGRRRPRLAGDPALAGADGEDLDAETADGDPVAAVFARRDAREIGGTAAAVVGGILYLALTVGWIYSVQLVSAPSTELFPEILWQFGEFTAMIAAPVWFAAVISLTRGRIGLRLGWFALGLGVLLPWPVLLELAG